MPENKTPSLTAASVKKAYQRVLNGESLDEMNVSDDTKDIIRSFSKYSEMSVTQISEKTGIPVSILGGLKLVRKSHAREKLRSRSKYNPLYHHSQVSAIILLLRGDSTGSLKMAGFADETIKEAKRCIRILERGGGAPELFKRGITHHKATRVVEQYKKTISDNQLIEQNLEVGAN